MIKQLAGAWPDFDAVPVRLHLHEILAHLGHGDRVLDLGSRNGSFKSGAYPGNVFRLDLEPADHSVGNFVVADAARLPFGDATFHAVIANHSLEHFADLASALSEIGRVVQPGGAFYAAVPNANTFSDRLYRWLSHGGGHVNAFRSAAETAALFACGAGLRCVGTRVLLSSFSFANRNNIRWSRRIVLLGGGSERFLAWLSYLCRACDRVLRTRFSHYGWAFYFGAIAEPINAAVWTNVCVRCGAAFPDGILRQVQERVAWSMMPSRYKCPSCGANNLFTSDSIH